MPQGRWFYTASFSGGESPAFHSGMVAPSQNELPSRTAVNLYPHPAPEERRARAAAASRSTSPEPRLRLQLFGTSWLWSISEVFPISFNGFESHFWTHAAHSTMRGHSHKLSHIRNRSLFTLFYATPNFMLTNPFKSLLSHPPLRLKRSPLFNYTSSRTLSLSQTLLPPFSARFTVRGFLRWEAPALHTTFKMQVSFFFFRHQRLQRRFTDEAPQNWSIPKALVFPKSWPLIHFYF